MPLPLFLGIGAAIAAAVGAGASIHGGVKMKAASDTMKYAQKCHADNMARFKEENKKTSTTMDKLGKLELEILHSFSEFSNAFEQIKNKPHFEEYEIEGVTLPQYDAEKLKEVSVGAGVLLSGIGGAALGTAGGFAAAGATTAAVMALGTASTGTAIASLSGAALTNATLAALGGGALAVGGGGMALGATMLGVTSAGVGLLVGGVIFSIAGKKLSDKADEAKAQMRIAEQRINRICAYLTELDTTAEEYYQHLSAMEVVYRKHLNAMVSFVTILGHTDWTEYSDEEKLITENTVRLVGVLYNMCKVNLVIKDESKSKGLNQINHRDIERSKVDAEVILEKMR